jgi:hypothetical protein
VLVPAGTSKSTLPQPSPSPYDFYCSFERITGPNIHGEKSQISAFWRRFAIYALGSLPRTAPLMSLQTWQYVNYKAMHWDATTFKFFSKRL